MNGSDSQEEAVLVDKENATPPRPVDNLSSATELGASSTKPPTISPQASLRSWPGFDEPTPSEAPSGPMFNEQAPSETPSELSNMAQVLAEARADMDDGDALAFEHKESFNILCAGESRLGKSTFLRNIFAHVDPTKEQEMKLRVAEQARKVVDLEDHISRITKMSRQCDDKRVLELREERARKEKERDDAVARLQGLREEKRGQEQAVKSLREEITARGAALLDLRKRRDAEADDALATKLAHEVIEKQAELHEKQEQIRAELHKANLDKHGPDANKQTREITPRLIKDMPLFEGSRTGLDVTLIDTPGYGDLLVDTDANPVADRVVEFVERRISAHLGTTHASPTASSKHPQMPLDDQKKYWNELVHLCLFFISPHQLKRADVELMRRLHALVPLVVVIAKSDTMTKAETLDFKEKVREALKENSVQTFAFDSKSIKIIESKHSEEADETFQPLYGGADGQWPWAVMGSDDSLREYAWGKAITDLPAHSEMPAVRDLLLQAGGWQQLKREASLKADAEGRRHKSWRNGWAGRLLGAAAPVLPRHVMAVGVVVAAVLLPHQAGLVLASSEQRRALQDHAAALEGRLAELEQQLAASASDLQTSAQLGAARHGELAQCIAARVGLDEDLTQCTEVRVALDKDLAAVRRDLGERADELAHCARARTVLDNDLATYRRDHDTVVDMNLELMQCTQERESLQAELGKHTTKSSWF